MARLRCNAQSSILSLGWAKFGRPWETRCKPGKDCPKLAELSSTSVEASQSFGPGSKLSRAKSADFGESPQTTDRLEASAIDRRCGAVHMERALAHPGVRQQEAPFGMNSSQSNSFVRALIAKRQIWSTGQAFGELLLSSSLQGSRRPVDTAILLATCRLRSVGLPGAASGLVKAALWRSAAMSPTTRGHSCCWES